MRIRDRMIMMSGTAGALMTMMLRVNIHTFKSLYKSNDETLSAAAAGVYIETNDTQRVPYQEQQRRDFCKKHLHTNLQRYKFAERFQTLMHSLQVYCT